MEWAMILLIIIALVAVIKFVHFKSKIWIIVLISLFLFTYVSLNMVADKNSIDLRTTSGLLSASKLYFSWIGQTFGNIKTLTAEAIKMDWAPKGQNISISTISNNISQRFMTG